MVARKRFELLSEAPEAPMLNHYTTGLLVRQKLSLFDVISVNVELGLCFVLGALLRRSGTPG